MKRILLLAAATFALCFMTTASHAQAENLNLRFRVPFPFTVENTTFAAGEYEVTAPAHLILEVRNVGSQAAAFEHAQAARSKRKQTVACDSSSIATAVNTSWLLFLMDHGRQRTTCGSRRKRSGLRMQAQGLSLK